MAGGIRQEALRRHAGNGVGLQDDGLTCGSDDKVAARASAAPERAVRALASHCFLSLPPEAEGGEPELKTHSALIRLYSDAAQAEPEQAQEEAQHE